MNNATAQAGIEQLLAMAAADGRFAVALLEDRQRAVEASGVVLSRAQQAVLDSVGEEALRGMILGMAGTQPEQLRRVFLGRAAAAVATLAGGVVLGTGAGCKRPDHEPGGAPPPVARPKKPAAGPEQPPPKTGAEHPPGIDHLVGLKHGGEITGIRPGGVKALLEDRPKGRLKTRVKLAAAMVEGGMRPELVRRIMRRHLNELKYCYDRELQKTPGLKGKMTVAFTINARGKVSRASRSVTTMGHALLEGCVVKAVKRWLFPKPEGGKEVQVNAPISFWVEGKKKKGDLRAP